MAEHLNNQSAIVWGTRRIAWGQMEMYCASVIGQLKAQGVKPGDRVAICAKESVEYIIVLFSLWRMKVIACPINPHWPAKMVSEYASSIQARLVLTNLSNVVCFDARRSLSGAQEIWQPDIAQEATIVATSGSSGSPKAAVHTWGNHYFSALGSQEVLPLTTHDSWILSLPLFHVSGLAIVVRCFLAQAAIVLPGDDLAQTIISRHVTHASLVSTQVERLLQTPGGQEALMSLKYVLLGGSAMPARLIQQLLDLKVKTYVSYGLTEMSSQVATGKAGESVKVLPHREMKISDDEILVRGKTLFKGYVQSGRIHLPLTKEGWFQTGDLGALDAEGALTVTGRKDNMFISAGENIHPEEIEKVLLMFPGIAQAVVVSQQDAEFGQRPIAFVRFTQGPVPDQELIKHCKQHLPGLKVPTAFYSWPKDIPIGLKPSRKEFRVG